ncbi:MAG: DNA cytosine methyltransferase [Pseudonocardiaceae bacterium]
MSRPRLLDLFCGAGGAAMGYHRAGFEVVGVDIVAQPHYPFRFIKADAIEFISWAPELIAREYDAIHASPPCQGYSRLRHLPWLRDIPRELLIEPVRRELEAIGLPWVIENVEDARMPYSVVLCGTMFDLPLYRHRRFGASFLMLTPDHRKHEHVISSGPRRMADRYKRAGGKNVVGVHAGSDPNDALGIDWMKERELSQAIPPAYTEWIGTRLLAALQEPAA